MTVRIYGYSDDLVEVDGDFRGENEYGAYDKPIMLTVHDFTNDKSCVVTVEYASNKNTTAAVWAITVEPIDEDKPMPPMSIELEKHGYSPVLIVDCSENTAVSKM